LPSVYTTPNARFPLESPALELTMRSERTDRTDPQRPRSRSVPRTYHRMNIDVSFRYLYLQPRHFFGMIGVHFEVGEKKRLTAGLVAAAVGFDSHEYGVDLRQGFGIVTLQNPAFSGKWFFASLAALITSWKATVGDD